MSQYNVGSIGGRVVLDLDQWAGSVQQVKGDVKDLGAKLKGELPAASEAAGSAMETAAGQTQTLAEAIEECVQVMDRQEAESRSAETATRQVGDAAGGAARQMDRAADSSRTLRERLKDIKSQAGEGSGIHQLSQLLVGGGIVAGFGLLAREINKSATEMAEMATAFRSGEASVGDLAERMLGAVPVFGQIWQAGRSIREVLTGEAFEISRVMAEMERITKLGTFLKEGVADSSSFAKQLRQITEQAREAAAVLGLPVAEREAAQTAGAREKQVAAVRQQLNEQLKRIEQEFSPKLQDASRRAGELQTDIANRSAPGFLGYRWAPEDFNPWSKLSSNDVLEIRQQELSTTQNEVALMSRARQLATDQARRETAAAVAALQQQFAAEDRAAMGEAGATRPPDVGPPATGGGAAPAPRITVHAPKIDETKLADLIRQRMEPYIQQQIRAAEAAAENARRNGQIRGGL